MGGWDKTLTQGTVIRPSTVKASLETMNAFVLEFNKFLDSKRIPAVQLGYPVGSSAYYNVDNEEAVYGDIDLQFVVPELAELAGKTPSQTATYWNKLEDEFVKTVKPAYVHEESEAGHPLIATPQGGWVQVDIMPHPLSLATWGRFRTTPERGVKGLLNGNMFSVLGEMLMMSIQHSGVQYKDRAGVKQPFVTTRKDYELVTLSTDIESFVFDIFKHQARLQGITSPQLDPLLIKHPGSNITDIKIANLANAIKGLARSFELNDMYSKGNLANYYSAKCFLHKFMELYEAKALVDINGKKRDKAATPEAIARADADRYKVASGLIYVKGLFNESI